MAVRLEITHVGGDDDEPRKRRKRESSPKTRKSSESKKPIPEEAPQESVSSLPETGAATPRRELPYKTRRELLIRAGELDIKGRHSMSKAQLENAVREHSKTKGRRKSVLPKKRSVRVPKKTLLQEAKDLEIVGRHDMPYEELRQAIEFEKVQRGMMAPITESDKSVKQSSKSEWVKFSKASKQQVKKAAGIAGYAVTTSGKTTDGSYVYGLQIASDNPNLETLKELMDKEGAFDSSFKAEVSSEKPEETTPQSVQELPDSYYDPSDPSLDTSFDVDDFEDDPSIEASSESVESDPLFESTKSNEGSSGPPPKQESVGPLFEATSGGRGGGEPPKTTFNQPEPDPEEPDSDLPEIKGITLQKPLGPQVDKLEQREEANRRRRLLLEITQAKRRADKRSGIAAKRERVRRSRQQQTLTEEAREARRRIRKDAERGDSDRLIRRLATFGIARAAGIDGGLLTALAELMVFQPEISQAQQEMNERLAETDKRYRDRMLELNRAKTETSVGRDWQSIDIAETVDEARIQIAEGEDVEIENVRSQLEDVLKRKVEQDPSFDTSTPQAQATVRPASATKAPDTRWKDSPEAFSPTSESEAPRPQETASGGSGSGTIPPSGTGGDGGGPEDPGKPENTNKGLLQFDQALSSSTKGLLMANVALYGMKTATDSVAKAYTDWGQILQQPDQHEKLVGVAGETAKTGSMLAGAGAGAMLDGIRGGVVGAVIGKAIGGIIVDPMVAAVSSAMGVFRSVSDNSIGGQTIEANITGSIDKMMRELEMAENLDEQTASFVASSNELTLTLLDLKETFISFFGGRLDFMIQILKTLAKVIDVILLIGQLIDKITGVSEALKYGIWILEKINDALDWMISWFKPKSDDLSYIDTINAFFGGKAESSIQGSLRNVQPSPLNNINAFNP